MKGDDDPAWRLLEAAEIVHAHTDGAFQERLAASVNHLFRGAVCALDVFMPDGTHEVAHNIPFDRKTEQMHREYGAAVILRDHPVVERLLDGRVRLGRLSDFVNRREFAATELADTFYRPFGLNFQMFARVPLPMGVGLFSVDRENADFSPADLKMTERFARHLQYAYGTEVRIREQRNGGPDQHALRERLLEYRITERENRVLFWLLRGKRNCEIALILGISTRTVEAHLSNSYRKLGVEGRTAALLKLADLDV